MDRRAFLRGLGALATGSALAGCTANREVPETAPSPPPGVREATRPGDESGDGDGRTETAGAPVADPESANAVVLAGQDAFPDDDQRLVVTITVRNEGDGRAAALVRVTVDTGTEVVVERFVSLQPGESTTVQFTPDAPYDDYSGHTVTILAETPATPLPSDTASPTPSPTRTRTRTPTGTPAPTDGT